VENNIAEQIEEVAGLVVQSEKIVIFTGAGVSTESGIPDFRSPGGIWSKYNPEDFTYQRFVSDPKARKMAWLVFEESGITKEANPNPAHYAVNDLNRLGKLDCVITQNVDNLHQKAGLPDDTVFELHGNMQRVICLGCGKRFPFAQIMDRVAREEEAPICEICQGILKPDAVFFGESLPEEVLREATSRSNNCDLFIVIGSSLVVYPAAYMPSYAVNSGAGLVIINLGSTPLDSEAAVLIRAKAGETMSRIVKSAEEKM